jgi:hypothetical protein
MQGSFRWRPRALQTKSWCRALVVMALTDQGASVPQIQIALCPLQCLDRKLLVDAQKALDVKADHIGRLGHELGVIALAPGFAGGKIDIVLALEAPDILDINVARCFGQQRTRPPHSPEAAAHPEAPGCACLSPCRRSASWLPADDPSAHQGHGRQSVFGHSWIFTIGLEIRKLPQRMKKMPAAPCTSR